MELIAISGKRGSGKDTLANALVKRGYTKISFALVLKAHVRDFFGWTVMHTDGDLKEVIDPEFNVTPRQVMIQVGQFYRAFDPLFWVKKAFDNLPADGRFVLSDLRFRNEANFLVSKGATIVRLNRRKDLNIYKGEINDVSETDLDNYEQFTHIVPEDLNLVLEDLEILADKLCTTSVTKG